MSPCPRIFVVDAEPVIASSLAAMLRMNGFSARFFTSPLEALAAVRSESPDLLISDVAMPGISRIELAEMVGTTRSRVSFFMNRFRKLGFIEYNGRIKVHRSLLNIVLHG